MWSGVRAAASGPLRVLRLQGEYEGFMNARREQSAEQLRSAIEEARDAGISDDEIAKAETRLKSAH